MYDCVSSLPHAAHSLCYEAPLIRAGLWEAHFMWTKITSCLLISIMHILKGKSLFSFHWNLVQNPGDSLTQIPRTPLQHPWCLLCMYLLKSKQNKKNLKARTVLNVTVSLPIALGCSSLSRATSLVLGLMCTHANTCPLPAVLCRWSIS